MRNKDTSPMAGVDPATSVRTVRASRTATFITAIRAGLVQLIARLFPTTATLSPVFPPDPSPPPRPQQPPPPQQPLPTLPDAPVVVELIYWENGRFRIDYLDDSPSLGLGIEGTTELAWEDDNATLAQSLFLIHYPGGRIAAVGIYQPGTSVKFKGRPDLLWVLANGAQIKLPCHYGIGEGDA
jgi:hypothetical protein